MIPVPRDITSSPIAGFQSGPWVMQMQWTELLFMHWPLRPGILAPLIPTGLELDTFDGQAWLGIVPFRMSKVRPRGMPCFPGASAFPELNVRTYVKQRGRTGVWFFSLDAASRLAVRGARMLWHLPYFDARMNVDIRKTEILYRSTRTHRHAPPARLVMRYHPTGPAYATEAGNLDHFLTNRRSLFSANGKGHIYRGDIQHAPWPLQPAEAEIELNEMTGQMGVNLPEVKPLLHFAQNLDVLAWRITRQPL